MVDGPAERAWTDSNQLLPPLLAAVRCLCRPSCFVEAQTWYDLLYEYAYVMQHIQRI